jgi:hypothetical protein
VARSELDSSLFAVARVSRFAEEDVEVEEDESIEAMLLCCCCCLIAPSIAAAS